MPDDTLKTLQSSKDPNQLLAAALGLAASLEPSDHEALLKVLRTSSFLSRLDSAEDYQKPPKRLRLSKIVEKLSSNPAASARQVLIELIQSPGVIDHPSRVDLLIEAVGTIRPSPPEVLKFWDSHWLPEDGYSNLTARAAVTNGSAPAISLFEKKMADPHHPEEDKLAWMHGDVLPHRNDLPLLQACDRLLRQSMPQSLRVPLVEVLFNYDPEWSTPRNPVYPPDRKRASIESLRVLRSIGEWSLANLKLDTRTESAVKTALKEIAERLQ